jgi:hypothetical protein
MRWWCCFLFGGQVFQFFLWCWLFWAAAVAAVMTVQLFWCWCIDCCDCSLVFVMTVQIFSSWWFTVAAAVCLFTLGLAAVRSSFGGSFIGNCFGSGAAWLCDWILVTIMRIQHHSLHFYCLIFGFIRGVLCRNCFVLRVNCVKYSELTVVLNQIVHIIIWSQYMF